MSKITELINSLNDENVDEVREQLASEANALNENNQRLYSRAKKAEGFEFNKETKVWNKKEIKKEAKEPTADKKPELNEPNYAKLAFLEQRGLKNADDQKMVQEEANRLKLPLTDILNMEHIKMSLKNSSNQREAQEGMPAGRGKPGGSTKGDVEYHLAKGTTPDDLALAGKVIAARENKETSGNKFSDELF